MRKLTNGFNSIRVVATLFLTIALTGAVNADQSVSSTDRGVEKIRLPYHGFDIWIDCRTKLAFHWEYQSQKDTNNYSRHEKFYQNDLVPPRCRQTSVGTYKNGKNDTKFHRGHLVPANVMDHDELSIAQTNIMSNIAPQTAAMNKGAWYQTELWVECRRNDKPLYVLGGVYQGNMPEDGDFMISHGVVAPEAFWKVAFHGKTIIAWWVPNSPDAYAVNVDNYLTTVRDIEAKIGYEVNVPDYLKDIKQDETNSMTTGCKWG